MSIIHSTQQTNCEDCGVYDAAYATELVCGKGVAGLQASFDVAAMRPHLERCLDEQEMVQFPRDASRFSGKRRKVLRVVVDVEGVNVIL